MTEETPPFVGPNGWKLRVDEEADAVWIEHSDGHRWAVLPGEDFEAFVAFWNRRDPLLSAAPRLLEAAQKIVNSHLMVSDKDMQELYDATLEAKGGLE